MWEMLTTTLVKFAKRWSATATEGNLDRFMRFEHTDMNRECTRTLASGCTCVCSSRNRTPSRFSTSTGVHRCSAYNQCRQTRRHIDTSFVEGRKLMISMSTSQHRAMSTVEDVMKMPRRGGGGGGDGNETRLREVMSCFWEKVKRGEG